jgi:hypothetical protein
MTRLYKLLRKTLNATVPSTTVRKVSSAKIVRCNKYASTRVKANRAGRLSPAAIYAAE